MKPLHVLMIVTAIAVAASGRIVDAQGPAAAATHPPAFTMSGDIALWTVAIKPDKTTDYEGVLAKLRHALTHSSDPTRQKQAAGWKVMRIGKPMPDGNVAYVHVISPVVPAADYAVLQTLYDELPDERQQLYDLYRGAFAKNLALSAGALVMDGAATTP